MQYAKRIFDSGVDISAVHDESLLKNYVRCNLILSVGDAGEVKHKVHDYGGLLIQVGTDQGSKQWLLRACYTCLRSSCTLWANMN